MVKPLVLIGYNLDINYKKDWDFYPIMIYFVYD